ncbi:MAG: hypothetical protein M0P73_05145 [Syntrophobacterales bacterium]|jgi:hypothetical protein|nr:hypothetical protein [Syntrophobacterales bacterium]
MTTLAALATKDALVLGCDSLGSVTKWMLDPFILLGEFFDPQEGYKLKVDKDGTPLLKKFDDVYKKSELIPYYHMTHVSKLFSLEPLGMGVMATGIASIGNRTIKSLIREFKVSEYAFTKDGMNSTDYTVDSIAQALLKFIVGYYEIEYLQWTSKPELEFMIGGYDKTKQVPDIYRIFVNENKIQHIFQGEAPFGIAFGGQMDEIQRIVFGTDWRNRIQLNDRANKLLEKYRNLLQEYLKGKGIVEELPQIDNFHDELSLFKDWNLTQFEANWGDFSNQNAIECVSWFVGIMIKSHEFRSHLPMVGGKVHLGLITKDRGFNFISKEEYIHEGHETPMEELRNE